MMPVITRAKNSAFSGPKALDITASLASGPNISLLPSLAKLMKREINCWQALKMPSPGPVLRMNHPKKNCRTNPQSTARNGKRRLCSESSQATPMMATIPKRLMNFMVARAHGGLSGPDRQALPRHCCQNQGCPRTRPAYSVGREGILPISSNGGVVCYGRRRFVLGLRGLQWVP